MPTQNGCGSKLSRRGYAGFGPCFHFPGFHLGTVFLSHSQDFRVTLILKSTPFSPRRSGKWRNSSCWPRKFSPQKLAAMVASARSGAVGDTRAVCDRRKTHCSEAYPPHDSGLFTRGFQLLHSSLYTPCREASRLEWVPIWTSRPAQLCDISLSHSCGNSPYIGLRATGEASMSILSRDLSFQETIKTPGVL